MQETQSTGETYCMQKRPVQNVLLPIFCLLHFPSDEKSSKFANESAGKRNQKVLRYCQVFRIQMLEEELMFIKIIFVVSLPDIRKENEGLVKSFT